MKATEQKSILQIENISKQIGAKEIVQPMDFDVSEGQVLALCGGNGAGKSTIIRMIVGLMHPTSGNIKVCGLEWAKQRKIFAQHIGYMPDDFDFGPALTTYEVLSFYAQLKRVSMKQIDEILHQVGLFEERHQRASQFSKGMKQRLLFAQALLGDPALLVLDEPTNGLDPFWMQQFIQLVHRLKLNKKTIVFSTHDLNIAEAVADHVMILNQGKIMSKGSIEEYHEQYGDGGLNAAFAALYHLVSTK